MAVLPYIETVEQSSRIARLKQVLAGEYHEGRDGSYLKLPLELFLHCISFLLLSPHFDRDLINTTHVCAAWRKEIISCRKLWSKMPSLDAGSLVSLDRVREWTSRSNGGLKELDIHISLDAIDGGMPIIATLRQILHEISARDGAKQLATINLDFGTFRFTDDSTSSYESLVLLAHFMEYSAVHLKTLNVISLLPRYTLSPIFASTPSVKSLTVLSRHESDVQARLPDFFSDSAQNQMATSNLQSLTLVNSRILDTQFPQFPSLQSLRLYSIHLPNLYTLLERCAGSLETLVMRGVSTPTFNEVLPIVTNFAPGGAYGGGNGTKDLVPVLTLPKLKVLQLAGHLTPLLFVIPTLSGSGFMVDLPNVRKINLSDQETWSFDDGDDDDDEPYEGIDRLTEENMSAMFRAAPNLTSINLSTTNATVPAFINALKYVSPVLTHLSAQFRATDDLVERLHELVPSLVYLDVRRCPVTLPALARFADRIMRQRSDRSSSNATTDDNAMHAASSLKILADKAYCSDSPSTHSLRVQLRDHVLSLSPIQVSHLAPSLNSPPNAPSFAVFRDEIRHLADPIPSYPPQPYPSDAKKAVLKVVASTERFNQCVVLLNQWVKRKEIDLTESWFKAMEAKAVYLLLGLMGDDDDDDTRVGDLDDA